MPPVVERGDKVTITSIKGRLMITAAGISCEDGMLGERIRVRNIDTERIVSGVVCRDKMVLVD
jgi:flagella basal body P-ring formation protein FlgA